MQLHADFTQRAVVHADACDWIASPMPGVARKMLDRVGGEVARATSIVRYDPGSRFSRHRHGGGEEFLVLDGVFQDEHGDYPAGAYLRNPPESSHTPGADAGCVILVKLWQFDSADRNPVRLQATEVPSTADPARPGVTLRRLHHDDREDVRIETWAADAHIDYLPAGGIELFLLDGEADEARPAASIGGAESARLRRWSWLRLPPGARLACVAGASGARVWIKEGHLLPDTVERTLTALQNAAKNGD